MSELQYPTPITVWVRTSVLVRYWVRIHTVQRCDRCSFEHLWLVYVLAFPRCIHIQFVIEFRMTFLGQFTSILLIVHSLLTTGQITIFYQIFRIIGHQKLLIVANQCRSIYRIDWPWIEGHFRSCQNAWSMFEFQSRTYLASLHFYDFRIGLAPLAPLSSLIRSSGQDLYLWVSYSLLQSSVLAPAYFAINQVVKLLQATPAFVFSQQAQDTLKVYLVCFSNIKVTLPQVIVHLNIPLA